MHGGYTPYHFFFKSGKGYTDAAMDKVELEGLKDLKDIKEELEEIKERTGGYQRSFVSGILYGAGWIIGGIFAIVLIGWFLSIIGLIPGLGNLSSYIHQAVDQFNAARR